jgi:hypothetical protein
MAVIQTKLQDTVDNLENWSEQNSFRFSQTMTAMIHFCHLQQRLNPHVDPKISLKGHDVKLVDSHKILGFTFDKRLDWLAHINYVKAIASKKINILKCVSNVRWGADQDSLLRIHQMLVLLVSALVELKTSCVSLDSQPYHTAVNDKYPTQQ